MAHWMGAAPRYLGSKEACELIQPSFGMFRRRAGIIWPYAMMTMASGLASRRNFSDFGVRIFSGWKMGMLADRAVSFTGGKETSWPRPLGRSGWVITATISKSGWARRCLSVGTAKFGVPQKRRRMVHSRRRAE